jgi:hypothetical protein
MLAASLAVAYATTSKYIPPAPEQPLNLARRRGFVRARHKRGYFEVIAGKSVLEFKRDDPEAEQSKKCFGFVQN